MTADGGFQWPDGGPIGDGGAPNDGGLVRFDGGAQSDGGVQNDGGFVWPDGGFQRDGGNWDGGLPWDGGWETCDGVSENVGNCPDAAGSYQLNMTCGTYSLGPYNITIDQQVCELQVCYRPDGGIYPLGSIDAQGNVHINFFVVLGSYALTAVCDGQRQSNGTINLTSCVAGIFNCTGTLTP